MKITEDRLKEIIQESINKVILEMSPRPLKPLEVFIVQAKEIHGDKYDYSKVVYSGTDVPVVIICPKHSDFKQTPHHHLEGQGCPRCEDSHLERETERALKTEGVEFRRQEPLGRQKLDFYLPQFNAAIECQGRQHYEAVWGEERLKQQKEWDLRKKDNCIANGIRLFEIHYTDIKIVAQKVHGIIEVLKNEGHS